MTDDLEDLRKQTQQGDRLDEAADQDQHRQLKESILAELEKIDHGDEQKTVSIWDGPIAAYVRALEEHPMLLEDVGRALEQQLGIEEADDMDRARVVRLALRLGLQQADAEQFDTMRGAVREQATKGL